MTIDVLTLSATPDAQGNWDAESAGSYPAGTVIVSAWVQADTSLTSDPRSLDIQAFLKIGNGSSIISTCNLGAQFDANNQSGAGIFSLPWELTSSSKIFASGSGLFAPADPPNPAEGIPVIVRISLEIPA